jgi:hypothetical protein
VTLDPGELGWQEFWLRIVVILLVLAFLMLVMLLIGKTAFTLVDLFRWVKKRIDGKGKEMTETSLSRSLLRLVPKRDRMRAERILQSILGLPPRVFVAEYDGRPATVHMSVKAAQHACARHLNDEPGPDIPWDWFPDEFGWVMRRVDMENDRPTSLLGGKVTETAVEL